MSASLRMDGPGAKYRWRRQRTNVALGAAIGMMLMPAPALAQARSEDTELRSQLCRVYAVDAAEGQPSELRANCRGQGLTLGRATSFEAVVSEDLAATLVDIRLGTDRRVLLLSIRPDGRPFVEDLSGQIALAAGRGPMSELAGVELDFGAFATSGEVGVRGRPEDTGTAKTDRIDLAAQIGLEQARGTTSETQN